MKSMTGFGRAAVVAEGRRVVVEIRSLNHRGLDVKVRGRDIDAGTEWEITRAVRGALARGAVTVSLLEESEQATPAIVPRLLQAHAAVEAARVRLGLAEPAGIEAALALLRTPGLAGAAPPPPWPVLRPAVEGALAALAEMRGREGDALAAEIGGRLGRLEALVETIGRAAAGLPAAAARRLDERVKALLAGVAPGLAPDPGRLAQEVALLADRLDVTEELVRLRAHIAEVRRLLGAAEAAEAAGRRIDFLVQEAARELNTTGAKVQDAGVGALVVEAKAELEKIREQAQNIE